MPLTLQFNPLSLATVEDSGGLWQFAGGQVSQNGAVAANYASVYRCVLQGTDSQNTAMITTTVFFIGQYPPENLTVQGSHDYQSGNQVGSVSAASSTMAAYIGQQYTFNGASNVLQIA